MSTHQTTDTGMDQYRDDWRSVARYSVRYQGLYFECRSHIRRTLATGLTYDEAIALEGDKRKQMLARGITGHILLEIECRDETYAAYTKVRAAREARENCTKKPSAKALSAQTEESARC